VLKLTNSVIELKIEWKGFRDAKVNFGALCQGHGD
jgi:hypothetical protein